MQIIKLEVSFPECQTPNLVHTLFFEPANESEAYLGLAPAASRFSVAVSTGNRFYCSLDLDWLWERNSVSLDLVWSAKCGYQCVF
jgi:hypothetical protein